jgi:catechol 2,3-dioxygenase-like lactoylglutathione lyase family enzyme
VDSSSYATLGRSLCLLDADHNSVELCTRRTDGAAVPAGADDGPIQVGRIGHVVMETTDLDAAEYFYGSGLGLTSLGRDQGETGRDRLALRVASGQLIFFEQVDALSGRSLFRCGEDRAPVPDATPGTPYRYKGAHLAMSVGSLDDFQRIQQNIPEFGGFDEGDRAGIRRPAGKPSTYFFDPVGNRLQLIII